MNLLIQIESIALSFLYGIVFSLSYNVFYYLLNTRFIIINIITNIFYFLVMFGIYYFLLYLVNYGQVHIYFLFILFFSFYLYNKLFVKLRVKWLKKKVF